MFDDRLELGAGKLFPGMLFASNPYSASNTSSFMAKPISGDPVTSYFEAIGLGVVAEYSSASWFIGGGFTDAKAEDEFDFGSLGDGVFAWVGEGGWRPTRSDGGATTVSLLAYRVDERVELAGEHGVALHFVHEFGGDGADHGLFGRYTWRTGGEGLTPEAAGKESPMSQGGHLGWSWNRAFGDARHRLAAALMYGRPNETRQARGAPSRLGIEVFWKFAPWEWLELTGDIQLVANADGALETIPGVRIKLMKGL